MLIGLYGRCYEISDFAVDKMLYQLIEMYIHNIRLEAEMKTVNYTQFTNVIYNINKKKWANINQKPIHVNLCFN